jgi:hypothetical protein
MSKKIFLNKLFNKQVIFVFSIVFILILLFFLIGLHFVLIREEGPKGIPTIPADLTPIPNSTNPVSVSEDFGITRREHGIAQINYYHGLNDDYFFTTKLISCNGKKTGEDVTDDFYMMSNETNSVGFRNIRGGGSFFADVTGDVKRGRYICNFSIVAIKDIQGNILPKEFELATGLMDLYVYEKESLILKIFYFWYYFFSGMFSYFF